jgi:hypothetical protein
MKTAAYQLNAAADLSNKKQQFVPNEEQSGEE